MADVVLEARPDINTDLSAEDIAAQQQEILRVTEAVLQGQTARALRMLDGLRAEGEAAVLVHWTLAADLQALKRARDALDSGRPLPMALQEARVWGARQRLFERVLPGLPAHTLAHLVEAASICDGLVKGLRHPDWPAEPWDALRQLVLMALQAVMATRTTTPRGQTATRLVLHAG